jgi:elongation factor P
VVRKSQHVKPGKGGAFNQVEYKELAGPGKMNERLRSGDNVETVSLDSPVKYNLLYVEGEKMVLMHPTTFEQEEVLTDVVGDKAVWLVDGMDVVIESFEGQPVIAKLPKTVTIEVQDTEPVLGSAKSVTEVPKPAVLANGVQMRVPTHIARGDKVVINIDLDEPEYMTVAERAAI